MTQEPTTAQVLNELLAVQKRSLLPRLAEAMPHVAFPAAGAAESVRRMVREQEECVDRLIEAILDAGGAPAPPTADLQSAGFHFLDFGYLLSRVVQNEESLLAACEAAIERLGDGAASDLVRQFADRHRRQAAELQSFVAAA